MGIRGDGYLDLTPREYQALTDIWLSSQRLTAQGLAMYANVNFRPDGTTAWEAEHFLGKPRQAVRVPSKEELLKWKNYSAPRARKELPDWAK